MEQELLTLLEHLRWVSVQWYVDHCLSFCPFSIGHCVVRANIDIECLYLSLYYCNALVYENKESWILSVHLRFMTSYYAFGIFKLFLSFCPFSTSHSVVCPSSIHGFWLTPLVSSNFSWTSWFKLLFSLN